MRRVMRTEAAVLRQKNSRLQAVVFLAEARNIILTGQLCPSTKDLPEIRTIKTAKVKPAHKFTIRKHTAERLFFFGFKRSDSVTQILLQLGLPSFNTLIHNSRAIFLRTWTNCPNMLVSHLRQLGLYF